MRSLRFDILMTLCYIFSRDCRSCRVLFAFGRGIVKLLPYNKQASSKLFPVGCVITDEKSLLTLSDNEIGDIHCDLQCFRTNCNYLSPLLISISWIDLGMDSEVLALHLDDVLNSLISHT